MNILIISQYFWPENFRVNDIAEDLIKKGHNVEILTGIPNYPEGKIFSDYLKKPENYKKFHGSQVHRIKMQPRKEGKTYQLLINYVTFFLSAALYILKNFKKKNFDIIFSFCPSPVIISFLAFLPNFKNSKKIMWLLDLWPDILFELKIINNFFLKYIFIKLHYFFYKKYDYIFVQSKGFYEKIFTIVKDKKKLGILYGWNQNIVNNKNNNIVKEKKVFNSIKKNFKQDFLNIIFTGNVGWAQNFDYLTNVILDICKNKSLKIAWHIFGSGRDIEKQKKIIKLKSLKNIYYYGYIKNEYLKAFIDLSNILLITLHPGKALNATIPGKFANYLHYNKTLLASISGPTKDFINKYNLGKVSEPNDHLAFKKDIIDLYNNKNNLKKLNNSKILNLFDKNRNLNFLEKRLKTTVENKNIIFSIIKNFSDIPFKKNFILSALNLAFLSYYASGKINFKKKITLWPDGIFFKIFKSLNFKKIPGRVILDNLKLPSNIKYLHIVGNANLKSIAYLKNKFKRVKVIHTQLPYASSEVLANLVPKLKENEITLIVLPTPKQEQIAHYISLKNKNYQIFCLGGALNMVSGLENPVPVFLDKMNLEFLWRLRFDTKRRCSRLIETFYIFFKYWRKGFFTRIKFR